MIAKAILSLLFLMLCTFFYGALCYAIAGITGVLFGLNIIMFGAVIGILIAIVNKYPIGDHNAK